MTPRDVECPKCDAPVGSSCGYLWDRGKRPKFCKERFERFDALQADKDRKEGEREWSA